MGIARRVGTFVMADLIGLSFGGDVEAKGKKLQARSKRRAPEVPPIAFYLADYGSVKGDAPSDVVKKCEARRAKTRRETLLRLGDRVMPDVIAAKTTVEDEPTDVYDVTISPHRNLFANGVRVHNY